MMTRVKLCFFVQVLLLLAPYGCLAKEFINLQSRKGIITSPRYPDHYPNHVDIQWEISASSPMRYLFNLTSFDIEESYMCKNDRLTIRSKHWEHNIAANKAVICDSMDKFTNMTFIWEMVDYAVEVAFETDISVTGKGFRLEYDAQDVDNEIICDKMRNSSAHSITISSKFLRDAFRFPANLNCSWEFEADFGYGIYAFVNRFEMEYYGESCGKDSLSIYKADKVTGHEDLLGRFCGRKLPWGISLPDVNFVRINLITDDSDNLGGFEITFTRIDFSTRRVILSEKVYQRIHGIKSGNFLPPPKVTPALGQSVLFYWHFRADPGFRIRITAQLTAEVSSRAVPAMFYEAPSDAFTRLRQDYDLSTSSIDQTTDGFHAVFQVLLPEMSLLPHLNLTYETFNFFLSGEVFFRYLDIGDYTYFRSGLLFRCCTYHALVAPPGKTVAFDLKTDEKLRNLPNDENCSHAGIVVYDGGFTESHMIGPVCETTSSRLLFLFENFVSSSSTIYVLLYSYAETISRVDHVYEIDPWPTTCTVKHVTLATAPSVSAGRPMNFTVSSDFGPDDCFLLYVHPTKHSEPPMQFGIGNNVTSAVLNEIWQQETSQKGLDEMLSIPKQHSKYSHQWSNYNSPNIANAGNPEFYLGGNNNVTWSQRLVRLDVGDVGSHICGEVSMNEKDKVVTVPNSCGTILYRGSPVTWQIREQDDRPFYWTLEILYTTLFSGYPADSCYLSVEEDIGQTKMIMRFMCIDMNLARLTRYRTMWPNSHLYLRNNLYTSLKMRYAKKYISRLTPTFHQAKGDAFNATCAHDSIHYNDFCYDFQRIWGQFSWMEAENACAEKGGHLVSVTSTHELEVLKQALLSNWKNEFFRVPLGMLYIGLTDIKQPGVYRWTDGNPLSVADWFHAWDKNNNILPHEPALPIDPKKSQPVPDRSQRCVAMVVGNVYFSTNWRKIGCLNSYNDPSYICKRAAVKDNVTSSITFGVASDNLENTSEPAVDKTVLGCLENWTYIEGKCYSLISTEDISKGIPSWKAIMLCTGIGGHIANGANFVSDTFLYYFQLWGINTGDGNVWIRDKQGHLGCTSVTTLLLEVDGLYPDNSTTCVINEASVAFVLCEAQAVPLSNTCLDHQFRCHDGTCVHNSRLCDRRQDCLGGEDESICGNDTRTDFFFPCKNGAFVSMSDVCDFWPDCGDASDETGCHHRACLSEEYRCGNQQCIPREKKCDFLIDCLDGSDEEACDWGVEKCRGFECPGGTCVPLGRVTDLIPDCPDGSEADEESTEHKRLAYYSLIDGDWEIKSDYSAWCPGRKQSRRCHQDRVTCMNRASVCHYDQNEQGDILYCRDGTHLKNCERYECPGMFKCPRSYCIPWYKVCDGQADCVGAADELDCDQYSCPGRLKCKGSNQCVTSEQICDGRVHCRGSWSDEQFCDLFGWFCPSGCFCKGYSVDCSAANLTEIPEGLLPATRVLLLQENRINMTSSSLYRFPLLLILRLYGNDIAYIPNNTFPRLYNLHTLDLRFNSITSLHANVFNDLNSLVLLLLEGNPLQILPSEAFVGLNSVISLNLSGLGIRKVERNALHGLPKLEKLDLSNNKISVLESGSLPTSSHIDMLHLTGNSLDGTPTEVFREVVAKKLWTDSFRFCCYVESSHVDECYPNTDVFSSCEDLLSTVILRSLVWFLGIACVLGNTMVIVWRVYSGFRNRPSVYVFNLSVSDTLMGVYLIVLASTDTFYRGNYMLNDLEWRLGSVCQFLGILTTVSCQMSMFTLLALAFDRFLSVRFPITLALHTVRGAWILMGGLWIVSLMLSFIPLAVPYGFEEFYGKNSICMPFSFTDPKSAGWEYATVVFVGLNSACLVVMIALYAAIYCRVRESQKTAGRTDRSDLVVARRLSLVLVTNIISWIPVIVASVISITAGPLTREMAAILTTVILPLNPALNPYLYTFSSCIKRENNKTPKNNHVVTKNKTKSEETA